MSIAYCKDCQEIIEGSTEECGACGATLCPYCFNEAGGLSEDVDSYIDPRYQDDNADK